MNENFNENPNQNVTEPGGTNPATAAPSTPENVEKPVLREEEKKWAMFCHLAGFALFIPLFIGQIVAPLILWLIKKDESSFVDDQGKEALNFQITMTIYLAIAAFLSFILIGIPILFLLVIFDIVMMIKAVNAVTKGEYFRYPYTLRLI
ncbi:MAG: DUF4870 domain-containing protein [Phycisphaerae bacterium]|jgi:uncharacterized Tic20 family protein|nr:DUF4870 domain-containing protein [Phycisphaerae bacterium]